MKKQTTKLFTEQLEKGRNYHRVDTAGNYFINGKCQNPKADLEGNEIGYNVPELDWKVFDTDVAENVWLSNQRY